MIKFDKHVVLQMIWFTIRKKSMNTKQIRI